MELFNQIQEILGIIIGVLIAIAIIMVKGPTKKDGTSDRRFTSSKYQEKRNLGGKIIGIALLVAIILEGIFWLIEKYLM
jgi:hypothetical protein